jgi:hypothetical protein
VARIDAPLLDFIWITLICQPVFDISQLVKFMRHTTRFQALNQAHVTFHHYCVQIEPFPPTPTPDENSGLRISCKESCWQLSSLAQVFTLFIPSICTVDHLYIYGARYILVSWQHYVKNIEWLEIFHPFTSVKNLYMNKEFASCVAPSLKDLVGERATDVLPALESIFLEELKPLGPVQEAIEQFVATRQLVGHPVAVSHWKEADEAFLR